MRQNPSKPRRGSLAGIRYNGPQRTQVIDFPSSAILSEAEGVGNYCGVEAAGKILAASLLTGLRIR